MFGYDHVLVVPVSGTGTPPGNGRTRCTTPFEASSTRSALSPSPVYAYLVTLATPLATWPRFASGARCPAGRYDRSVDGAGAGHGYLAASAKYSAGLTASPLIRYSPEGSPRAEERYSG